MPIPKNFIKKLQYENGVLETRLESVEKGLALFTAHIAGEKFQTVEGGERADWIATADVGNWIEDLRMRASFGEIMRDPDVIEPLAGESGAVNG
jgi:hypothetical protein